MKNYDWMFEGDLLMDLYCVVATVNTHNGNEERETNEIK